jgi:hypothetical protein
MWAWKSGEMGIAFVRRNVRIQYVEYLNIGELGREAYAAKEGHEAQEHEQRKAPF